MRPEHESRGGTRVKSSGRSTRRKCLVCYLGGGGVITPSGELIRGEEEGPGEAETMSSHSDQFGLSSLGICWTPLCIDRPGPREGPVVVAHGRPLRIRTAGINEVMNGESTE